MFLLGEGTSVSFQYCQHFAELRMMLININNSHSISYHLLSTCHVLIKGIQAFYKYSEVRNHVSYSLLYPHPWQSYCDVEGS